MNKLPPVKEVPSTYSSEWGPHIKRRKRQRRAANRDARKYSGSWKPEDSVALAYKEKGDGKG